MENIRLKCGCGNILEGNNASLCDSCAKERTNTYDVENVYLMRRAREELIDRFKNPNRRVESAPKSQYDVLQTMPETETLGENGDEGNNFPYLVCGNVARRLERQKDPYVSLLDPDNEIVVRRKKPVGLETSGVSYPFDDAYTFHNYPNTRSHCCNCGVNIKLDLPKVGRGRGNSYSVECSNNNLPLIFSERGFRAADPGEKTRSMSFARRKHAPQESSVPRLCRDCGCEVADHISTSSTEKRLPPLDHKENRSRDRRKRINDFERSEIRNRRMSRFDDSPDLPVSERRELARKLADFRGAKIDELRRRMDDDRRRQKPRKYRNHDVGELRNGRVVKGRDAVQRQPWKSLYEDRMELEKLKKKRRESRSSSDTPHGCKYKYRKSKEKTIQEIECDNTDYIHNKKKQEKLDRLILEREIQLREDEKRREEEEEKLRNARKEAEERARKEQQKRENMERMLHEKELQRRRDEEREKEARRRQEEEERRREERRREEEEKLRKAREEAEERA